MMWLFFYVGTAYPINKYHHCPKLSGVMLGCTAVLCLPRLLQFPQQFLTKVSNKFLPYRSIFFAIDFNTTIPKTKTFITGEWAWINVDVPENYTQQYGNKQQGGFIDLVQPILKRKIAGWDDAVLNLACRFEYVDWNLGNFKETGGNIGDDLWSIMPAISFRPTSQTVFRLNCRHQRQRDILGNDPAKTGGFSFGISTYF